MPSGVEAFVATLGTDELVLTKIAQAGDVIPADNAVILKSSVSEYTLEISEESSVSFTATNNLHGTNLYIQAPENCYVLSGHSTDSDDDGEDDETGVGFYRFS